MNNKTIGLLLTTFAGWCPSAFSEDRFDSLRVGGEVYSNVTVTTVTATDIYFSHAKGMGNAKLKNLATELQKRFHFDPAKSSAVEKAQTEATKLFLQHAATNRPPPPQAIEDKEDVAAPELDENGELVATKLFAASFRGQRPPQFIVEEWFTPAPDVTGKFVLVEFWATWARPCRESIPHLNELQSKFKDKLVVIGLSNETLEDIKKLTTPKMNYYVGTDTQARSLSAVQVRGIPHALLMDPEGIVRYEGQPTFLDAKYLETLMAKYSK
ncbi:MAG: TlpA family protein disulfide reductase [Akkermansiaceae bacterium]|nr:TlpA family protein disulfide reductase [Verrucomicrobiales bacterium]